MQTIKLQSWNEFRRAIEDVRLKYGNFKRPLDNGLVYDRKNRILFRGQSDAAWPLNTTLERKSTQPFDILKYMLLATGCVKELESFTGHRWNTDDYPDLKKGIEETQDSCRICLPHYDYLVYLRQFGFPSPLLDWTESPYIAAYFSYLDTHEAENVSVYCYIEYPESGKSFSGGEPLITVKGPHVRTHARHFAQKAWYTVATKWKYDEKAHFFCSHELVFDRNDPKQDVLIKIELPASDRKQALEELNDYNINHFTLFQSEDSLVKALELKTFDMRDV